ncbi:N-6 DNA methylase [Tropicibacter sp. R16_0]|uniref:HsdM family class I SAM-dependent methyltransferase n=1 Tax=Tropicibacter sp. R16_0 TaxID=2821102 RepID=UPI001ADB6A35|nr:N-6 DNA methylase [Tropicibacter sp. R16_0]MBO9451073.1 N-6 DNA methylase [Tropicibacter sp. R16_0]
MLGELVDLFSNIKMHDSANRARDLLGRVYEYFISGFASSEGKRGGEFFTPRSVVRTLVEMLEPYQGRVYDPCCGSGGMFIQSEKFIEDHGGNPLNLSVYGQEINHTTWRLAKMNLAVHGIDAASEWDSAGSFHKDMHPGLKADYILANPPFNISDWGGDRLIEDDRWQYASRPRATPTSRGYLLHLLTEGGVASDHPSEVLHILNATIPQRVPYLHDDLEPLLNAIQLASPDLTENPQFVRLSILSQQHEN